MHEYDIVMDFIRKTVYLLGTALYKINHVQNEILHRKINNTILRLACIITMYFPKRSAKLQLFFKEMK